MTEVILFVFGAVVGSFLNVVGLRFNSGLTYGGRSACATCARELRWWELIPILSFLTLRARCSGCRTKISWQYPLVELWTGLIFATVPWVFIPSFALFVVITIYDLRHKIIPDALVFLSIVLALLLRIILGGSLLDWLAGVIIFTFFASVWFLSHGRAMGFGDAKLSLAIGLLLGGAAGLSAVVVAFWLGAFFGLAMFFSGRISPLLRGAKNITMKTEIPFAPFLVLGAWLSLVFNLDLLHVSLLF